MCSSDLPKVVKVTSEEIRMALEAPIKEIVKSTRAALDNTPPELASDLIERGIVMCGGGALLRGLTQLISEQTGLPVILADDPMTAVVMGTGRVLDELDQLRESRFYKHARVV